jgi:hypothetical protein
MDPTRSCGEVSHPAGVFGITRRGFLLGAATGLAAGATGGWYAARLLPGSTDPAPAMPPPGQSPEDGMPGPYPGR